jgi:glycosyltransferase involved in cell wall biosynthesis
MPRLTIIMPVLNGMPYIKESAASILSQSFKDFRLIIINDGSTDGTGEYLCSLKDERITIIKNKTAKGVIDSFNEALKITDTEYVARADADDICHEQKFEKQIKFLDENKDVLLAGTSAYHLSEDGRHKGWKVTMPPDNTEIVKSLFNRYSAVIQPAAVMRTEAVKKVGGYRQDIYPEDYDLYFRLIEHGKLANIQEYLYSIRLHKRSMTGQNIGPLQEKLEKLRISYIDYYRGLYHRKGKEIFRFLEKKRKSGTLTLFFDIKSVVYYRKGLAACLNGKYISGYLKLLASAVLSPKRTFNYSKRFFFKVESVGTVR